jgi:hypothetical protein
MVRGGGQADLIAKVGLAYRRDADCCKRYKISAKHFSFHGSADEDIYSEEQFSALDFFEAPGGKLLLAGKGG